MKIKKLSFFALVVVLAMTVIATGCNDNSSSNNSDLIYEGIDVSEFQGAVDFNKVAAAGIDAVYIRAGIGDNIKDVNFEQNYKNASEAGLKFGFYYFVTAASITEAESQAEFFASLIDGTGYNMAPAMDFEKFGTLDTEQINQIGLAFIQRLAELTGETPAIYTDASDAQTIWNSSFAKYPLWIADYSGGAEPPQNQIWSDWSGYQYSDTGDVDGISVNVDLDKFKSSLFI